MEDIIKALLDVVRAQHSAAEGTEEEPFDMDDIVDMAMNIVGRPDESDEAVRMVDSIQKLVEALAPDIFPPKTFEEMDDVERAASAASMIEERLRRGRTGAASASGRETSDSARPGEPYAPAEAGAAGQAQGGENHLHTEDAGAPKDTAADPADREYGTADAAGVEFDAQETAELNDLIYKNLMEMMGLQTPQVEYPFDQSQIRYGREKSITEMLEEEQAEEERLKREQMEMDRRNAEAGYRPVSRQEDVQESEGRGAHARSAWELAQDAVNQQTGAGADRHGRSAWELAQDAVNEDEKAHEKEPYIPKVEEAPSGQSASQLAAEAVRRSQEADREKLEIEKQAERLMEEARKRGQDPMKFALHQQEILQYMEKNSDELVSFEDYEDLTPEEKYEIEKQLHIEKQLADGVHPDDVDEEVPEEFLPEEIRAARQAQRAGTPAAAAMEADGVGMHTGRAADGSEASSGRSAESGAATGGEAAMPVLTEEMLRQLSQEVLQENSEMILSENADEDMDSLNERIFENIRQMMRGSGATVQQEDVGDLLEQAAASARGEAPGVSDRAYTETADAAAAAARQEIESHAEGLSAVELAKAAQRAARPEPKEVREGRSAVELAKEAQEKAAQIRRQEEGTSGTDDKADLSGADGPSAEAHIEGAEIKEAAVAKEGMAAKEEAAAKEDAAEGAVAGEGAATEGTVSAEDAAAAKVDAAAAISDGTENPQSDDVSENLQTRVAAEPEAPDKTASDAGRTSEKKENGQPDEEYEYVDPDELVLGGHTQAEIDEALDNLNSLGLEGDVYERARRMLLLELAGSEGELDAWLEEQEKGRKKKASVSALDHEDSLDLDDLDEDALEKELELAMDEDFLDEEPEEPQESGSEQYPDTEPEDVISEVEVEDVVPVPEGEKRHAASDKVVKRSAGRRVVRRREKQVSGQAAEAGRTEAENRMDATPAQAEEKEYQVSLRHPFVLKNSASFMDQFESYIQDTQENRKLSTGFRKLDAILRYGLHKGTYFIDAEPQYLKNSFMQQMADRAAESGVDVLYISTELSRYDLMVETISRLSYEIHGGDPEKAVSAMDIMTGENGADLESLKDELNWYRGRISEHLYILDQEVVAQYASEMNDGSAGNILEELIRSIVREGAHKPVVFIDNIENILSIEDTEDMKPLMDGIRRLAAELGIPILMSYGYAQAESETEISVAEQEFHAALGNMCDVYMELQYADMITEDSVELTEEDIQEMAEDGETLLINVFLHRNHRPLKASCQIQAAPKFNFYEE